MSRYYSIYLGYQTSDSKIYPLLPFDYKGNLYPIIYCIGSFSLDIDRLFYKLSSDLFTEELKNAGLNNNIYYLPINELPSDNYIKEGYFLIEDVERYLKTDESNRADLLDDIFYDRISKEVYAAKMQNELTFGFTNNPYDEEEERHSCSEYMYFTYPDRFSNEYIVSRIKEACASYDESYQKSIPYDAKIVAILDIDY